MRDLIFRGKAKTDGRWIISDSIHQEAGRVYLYDEVKDIDVEVIPDTVGQYTGLTDNKGVNIFEGDIVAGAARWLERMRNGLVAFRWGSFGSIWYRGDIKEFNPFTSMCNVECEIIGNIHDNGDLL